MKQKLKFKDLWAYQKERSDSMRGERDVLFDLKEKFNHFFKGVTEEVELFRGLEIEKYKKTLAHYQNITSLYQPMLEYIEYSQEFIKNNLENVEDLDNETVSDYFELEERCKNLKKQFELAVHRIEINSCFETKVLGAPSLN